MQYCLPGDILFYKSSGNAVADKLISTWTNSDITHCSVAVCALLQVESTFNGVVKTPINYKNVALVYSLHDNQKPSDIEDVTSALLWLDQQIGKAYGWGDIINGILSKFESAVTINIEDLDDCSGLAADFLKRCTGTPASTFNNVHTVTPVQLARTLGVVK